MTSKRKWRRAAQTGLSGKTEPIPDDWLQVENYGQHEGRSTLQKSGSNKGLRVWEDLIDRDGQGCRLEGICDTGGEMQTRQVMLIHN